MTTNHIKTRLQRALRDQLPPEKIKLWPSLQERLVTSNHPLIQTQGTKMKSIYSLRNRLSIAAFVLLAFFTLTILMTPQGRALAQGLLQFFTRANTDALPLQTDYAVPAESPRTFSLTEAEAQAGFDVLSPATLPEELSFQGASYTAENRTVIQQFGYGSDIRLSIKQQPFSIPETCDLCGMVGTSASVQTVQIGAATGEYAEGVWELTDNGPVWHNTPYLKTLRWQKDGMAYELIYMGDDLPQADLVNIATSLQP